MKKRRRRRDITKKLLEPVKFLRQQKLAAKAKHSRVWVLADTKHGRRMKSDAPKRTSPIPTLAST